MNTDNFKYRTHCELIITSKDVEPEQITQTLGIEPLRSFKKGETFISKHSGSKIVRPHNLWAISSEKIEANNEKIDKHIQFFQELLSHKIESIREVKNNKEIDIAFWIWIETDNAGIGLDITSTQLEFISKVSNRTHIALITDID